MYDIDVNLFRKHGNQINTIIKSNPKFPVKTSRLKNVGTSWAVTRDGFVVRIDGQRFPYAHYLNTGTRPHNIPKAFGRPLPFGTCGNFDSTGHRLPKGDKSGYFHSGSQKHKNWIFNVIIEPITRFYLDERKAIERPNFNLKRRLKFREEDNEASPQWYQDLWRNNF